jgi:hypothetical protein
LLILGRARSCYGQLDAAVNFHALAHPKEGTIDAVDAFFLPEKPCLRGGSPWIFPLSLILHTLKSEIAAAAAALVVEEGLEYGPAKRRAIKQLGLGARTEMPDNDVLEEAVREYLALFCADTQPAELLALRQLALVWMERLADFRPHLSGAVWLGTATRLSDIYIQLFCDDPKSAELALIEHNVDYEPRTVRGFTGADVEALSLRSVSRPLNETIGVHLMVYDHDDLRGALRPDAKGRTPRGDVAAVRQLLSGPPGP